MSSKKNKYGDLFYLVLGLLLLLLGLGMIVSGKVVVGIDYLTQLGSGYSGYFLLLIGVVVILVYYYTLPPFGAIRKFFEGRLKSTSKKKKE
ncbi:hypothetical protein [Reichenbachiella sp.]|uniref:hypothetical protein n=1 Tax=Reichenbachiella sp. TaxID=2184521 RepID=UPI003B5A09E6